MEAMPLISVIVPVHNAEACLERCLQSIVGQEFSDFEAILVNDGSRDSSGRICEEWAGRDARLKVVHKENGGVSSARNSGLDRARGAWVVFVDSDDWLDAGYLAAFAGSPFLRAETLLFQGWRKVGENGVFEERRFVGVSDPARTIAKNDLFRQWSPWGKFFNRGIVEVMGLRFDETLSLGEDSVFFFRYLSGVREVHVVEGAGYNYRVSAAGLSRRPLPWESHRRGGEAIAKVALPVLRRLLRGEFFYRKRLESLLLFGQHVFRLPFLYSSDCDGHARRKELSRVFRGRWRLLKTASPLFCGNARHALLWCLFLVLPLCVMDFLLSRFFGGGGFGSVSRQP